MDRWILALIVSALFAMGGFWFLLMNARWRTANPSDSTSSLSLRHGRLFRAYACSLFLVLELIIGSFALFYPPVKTGEIALLVTFALVVAVMGLAIIWDAYRFGLDVTSKGIDCHSPWRGDRHLSWSDIEKVSFSTANLWFTIEPKTGHPFHVLAIVPGVQQFLAVLEANLPHAKLVEAEPGYDWVWRKFPHVKNPPPRKPGQSPFRVWLVRALVLVVGVALLGVGIFCANGLVLASGEKVVVREIPVKEIAISGGADRQVVVVSYNIAKAFAHREGLEFEHPEKVTQRLQQLAQVIAVLRPDIVCLSEVMTEAGTMPIDQLEFLAKATRLPYTAFGENYNYGVPGYRIVGGNAILSRTPLKPVANLSLAGRQPFYVTKNNRRALFAETEVHGQTVLIGSLHNDSFNPANNEAQIRQIVDFVGERPCILAGDFNATPDSPAMKIIDETKHFSGEIKGNATFPASAPTQRIDYVFGPPNWVYQGTQVIPNAASDHRPVVTVFTVPGK